MQANKFDGDPVEAPAAACWLNGGEVQFADAKASGAIPISMIARSADPIDHWWWGRVVHDMDGMQLHKSRLPIDYCHAEEIGFLNEFNADPDNGLVVSGSLVQTGIDGDPVAKLVARQRGGVPYEASINFAGPMSYEFVAEDQFTEVNGDRFDGPGIVIREWQLRGVAVCPYGADMNTESNFQGGDTVALTKWGADMPTKVATNLKTKSKAEELRAKELKAEELKAAELRAKELKAAELRAKESDAEELKAEELKAEELKAEELKAEELKAEKLGAEKLEAGLSAGQKEAKRYVDAFGEKGAAWFAEGLSFEDARTRELSKLRATATKQEQTIAKLNQRLTAPAAEGEGDPIKLTPADKKNSDHAGFAGKIVIK